MDEGLSRAVRKVFVQLYDDGLIYQGDYIINWCCRCHTALSDLEVEHEELDGHFYHIRYPYADGSGGSPWPPPDRKPCWATRPWPSTRKTSATRICPAEAVILPLMDREIPIIRDAYVDLSTGTGALKVTPAHDPNDFEIGQCAMACPASRSSPMTAP
jgi:valyl-tRNA synthetase